MNEKSIVDVPNEILEKYVLNHLSNTDVKSFKNVGCTRFMEISSNVINSRSKYYRKLLYRVF